MFKLIFSAKLLNLFLLKSNVISTNDNIMSALIGALIGSLFTWLLAYITEKYRFNKRKKGAYTILNSEINTNILNLEKYTIYYPLINRYDLLNKGTIEDIKNFYKDLDDFPNIKHDNWDRFIEFVPDIFREYEIGRIIKFNSNLDKLMLQAEHLSKNPLIFDEKQKNIKLNDIEYARYIEITKQYKMFEKNFNDLLEDSENIKNLFEEKRKNFDYFKYNILIIIIGYIIFCSILILVKIYFK
ncbi:hypothetical protein [Methanobrevibacter sp.]|uniref:hypothetical protein n=1 Tax=Methanobrevibacter sp. TaxID=66852 RepID=UPI002E76DC9B|nr:hypothetical protein [Methanobrevibacter sp.]MEE0024972.1 hypothetical protein [Methanobrevibacter sp.]